MSVPAVLMVCRIALSLLRTRSVTPLLRSLGCIEIDLREVLTVGLLGCRFAQPLGAHRLAQHQWRTGEFKFNLGSHLLHLATGTITSNFRAPLRSRAPRLRIGRHDRACVSNEARHQPSSSYVHPDALEERMSHFPSPTT